MDQNSEREGEEEEEEADDDGDFDPDSNAVNGDNDVDVASDEDYEEDYETERLSTERKESRSRVGEVASNIDLGYQAKKSYSTLTQYNIFKLHHCLQAPLQLKRLKLRSCTFKVNV
jgi:hypothetical protein